MNNIHNLFLKPTDTVEMGIQVLDKMAEKIVLIVDRGDRLLGTVTDGDIRRALIQHHEMNTHLSIIMHKSPVFAYVEDGREVILEMMKDKSILQVPILDSDNKVVGLETLQHLFEVKKRDTPVFLMAGGFGTRLHPLTHDTPKPMLKVGRKPILEIILDQFIEAGFYNFIISTHYKAEMISGYFGDGSNWGVSIRYVCDSLIFHFNYPIGYLEVIGVLVLDMYMRRNLSVRQAHSVCSPQICQIYRF